MGKRNRNRSAQQIAAMLVGLENDLAAARRQVRECERRVQSLALMVANLPELAKPESPHRHGEGYVRVSRSAAANSSATGKAD